MPSWLRFSCAVALLPLAAACETPATSSAFQAYTAIYVDPQGFRGQVACSEAEGAMRSYVATLYQVSKVEEGSDGVSRTVLIKNPREAVVVASSPPTPCHQPATFSQIIPGQFYAVEIDAYDTPACSFGRYDAGCLSPAGGWSSGARTQLLAAESGPPKISDAASPRWQTRCGRVADLQGAAGSSGAAGAAGEGGAGQAGAASGSGGAGQAGSGQAGSGQAGSGQGGSGGQGGADPRAYDPLGPTEAVYLTLARIGGCEPLAMPEGPAGVVLRSEEMLGGLRCGKAQGEVSRLAVSLGGATRQLDCGAEARFSDLNPGQSYEFKVLAFEGASSLPRWGSRCQARAAAGLVQPASCEAPSERGSLRLPGAALCDGAASFRARAVGLPLPVVAGECPSDALYPGLPSGLADVVVERRDAGGALLDPAVCTGQVEPGQLGDAACSL